MYKYNKINKIILIIIFLLVSYLIIHYLINNSRFGSTDVSKLDYFKNLFYKFKKTKFEYINNGGNIDNINQIYVIAMPQRKEYVLEIMKSLGLNFSLFNAVKPDDLTYNDYSVLTNIYKKNSKIFNRKTVVGCGFSHLSCYLDAILNNYKNIIVLEDDMKLNVTLQGLKNGIQEFLNSKFQLFFMGYCLLNCNQNFNKSEYKYITSVPDRHLLCTHSTAIKIESIVPFLENIFTFNNAFDGLLIKYIQNNKINICVPYSPYFIQNEKLGTLNENPQNLKELEYCNI